MRSRLRVIIGCCVLVSITAACAASAWPSVPSARPVHSRASAPSRTTPPQTQLQAQQSQLQQVQQQIADRQRQLTKTKRAEHRVLGELSRTEERLHAAETQLHKTTVALTGTRRAVVDANHALLAVSRRLALHQQIMEERLQAFYKDGPLGYIDVLLGAAD